LARVSSANCGTTWNQTLSFDPFGNITKTGTSSWQATYGNNRAKTITGCAIPPGYSDFHDANGNLITDCNHTYAWDADGHATTVDTVAVTYDALGRVVEQYNGTTYTQVLYTPIGSAGLMNGETFSKLYIALPGGSTVKIVSGNCRYIMHADHLGSARLSSAAVNRTFYYSGAYAPYGESYAASGTTNRSFTGLTEDTVNGVYDFPFRRYS